MAYDFDKACEDFSFSAVATTPKTDGTAAPRNPLSRAGSEQDFSPTQPRIFFGRHESYSSEASSVPLPPGSPSYIPEKPFHLADFFPDQGEPRTAYSDPEIHEISRCLKFTDQHRWSDAPRLYIVLRMIGQLTVLDILLDEGINDLWFPFTPASVPKLLSPDLRVTFLDAQQLVLTKAVDLETGSKRHTHFGKDDAFPFEIRGKLGRGASANVDTIYNPLSHREFARKRFRKGRGQSKGELDNFKNELQVLKRIQHDHCIKLVASYTDSKYFGLIMSPIADCNLAEYYGQVPDDPRKLGILRKFYGCLASALRYLHESQIRHRDIKPENILVKNDRVYLTDFGIALDWESLGRSTTTEDAGKTWIYCAPEVAQYEKRNWSSDIWSLGCVFLEMTTVLKGRSITEMQEYFRRLHGSYRFYKCKNGIAGWAKRLRASDLQSDNLPLKWIDCMLRIPPESRPSAEDLYQEVTSQARMNEGETQHFIGGCCLDCGIDDSDSDSDAPSDPDTDSLDESHGDEATPPPTPSLKSARTAVRPVQAADTKDGFQPVEPPISPVLSQPLSPKMNEPAICGRTARPSAPAVDTGGSWSPTPPLGNKISVPYPSFSRAHSKEAIRSTEIDTGLQQNITEQKPIGVARVQGLGLESEDSAMQNAIVETPSSLPRITMDQEAMLDDLEIHVMGRDDTAGDANNLAAEMTAALLASRSRRTSAASDMPRLGRSSNAVNPFSDNLQSLKGWQTIGLVNNLPGLGSLSWAQPSHLLHDVKSDLVFMTYLQSNYKDCYDVVSVSTLEHVSLLVELLLRNGLKLDTWDYVDEEGISPLFRVLDWGERYQSLFKIMVNSGANLSYETADGRSPLSQAAGYGYIWAIKILVDAGADLQKHTRHIALVDAAENNHLETVEYLVSTLEAEPDLKGADGRTALRAASINGHVEIMNYFLRTCRDKVDIENKVNEQSILYDACVGGKTEVVRTLLGYGADPNATSGVKTGKWTPLIKAVQASNIEIAQALIDKGAKISAKTLPIVSGAGPLGTTAMNEAKKCGNARMIKFLDDERKTQAIVKRYQSVKNKKKSVLPRMEVESEEE